MNVAVVVLHYETCEDTDKCINSLYYNNQDAEFDVVVVDNGSPKGKILELRNRECYKNVHVIESQNNLGFANGNNLGFQYAKNKLNAQLIILANNDLLFEQKSFIKKLIHTYEIDIFDVAGPKIVSLIDGKNQNPVRINFTSVSDVDKRIIKFKVLLALNYLGLDRVVRKWFSKPVEEYELRIGDGYQLHGACIIFGEHYIGKYDGLHSEN